MSLIKQFLHDKMEREIREQEEKFFYSEHDGALFFNADKHHELEQAMREEMDPPKDIDSTYENFILNHPDEQEPSDHTPF